MHATRLVYSNSDNSSTGTSLGLVRLKNTGHGFTADGESFQRLLLTGGGLKDDYRLIQFHFHWGVAEDGWNLGGSEHLIDGRRLPVELHLVHIKSKFTNVSEALGSKESDALAVVGVLFEIDNGTTHGRGKHPLTVCRAVD